MRQFTSPKSKLAFFPKEEAPEAFLTEEGSRHVGLDFSEALD
jgi:hypothetical protein